MSADPWTPPTDARHLLPSLVPHRLLDPAGRLVEHASVPDPLGDDDLLALHRLMVTTRAVDREAINLQRQGQLGLHISSRGQEAAQVGSAYASGPADRLFPQGRELGVALARGLDPADLLHVWRGTWHAHHDPAVTGFGYYTIPIATQCLHAVGWALGAKLDGAPAVAVCYVGDGGTSEGDFHEALNMAAVWHVPCVFVVQNNQYALSVPVAQQTRAPSFAHKAVGYGMPGVRVDGNDVLATYEVAAAAVERARRGGGPTLIEAVTYRLDAHSTSDDAARYRPDGELERWTAQDPLARFAAFLRHRGALEDRTEEKVRAGAAAAAQALRDAIFDAPHPEPAELFAHVYTDVPAPLSRQRTQLEDELRRG